MNILKREVRKKKIAYVSGTRADFGLMISVLTAIRESRKLDLQLYATGMHVMPQFGMTINEMRKRFPGTAAINVCFKTNDPVGAAKFSVEFLGKIVSVFDKQKPDFVLTLGDRPEMLCTALACLYLNIPSGHLHGGEKTRTIDEISRHAITKLSHLHFPATIESSIRIEKMGEEKWRIHIVGAPAMDIILNKKLPSRQKLFKKLGLDVRDKVILIVQHPVSDEWEQSGQQMKETITALKSFKLPKVIIYPNADAGSRSMIEVINREKNNPLFKIFPNLPFEQFLALEKEAAVWVGNSSGAIIESSSFHTPVVNIGTRQDGREQVSNIINVGYNRNEIKRAIEKSLNDRSYLKGLKTMINPWGDGGTGPRIVRILEKLEITPRLLSKQITY